MVIRPILLPKMFLTFISNKRWIALCLLVISVLFLWVNYHRHKITWPQDNEGDISIDVIHQHKLRKERMDRVCRGRRDKVLPVLFVTPADRYNSCSWTDYKPMAIDAEEMPVTSHYHLASGYQTMGCLINKVASSSFISAFLKVQGLAESLPEHDLHQVHSLAQQHLLPKVIGCEN